MTVEHMPMSLTRRVDRDGFVLVQQVAPARHEHKLGPGYALRQDATPLRVPRVACGCARIGYVRKEVARVRLAIVGYESCRRIGAPVKEYLAGVLPGLDRRTLSQLANLTPARWNASRG